MNSRVVYGVYKNADMTEGRGPMILDSVWGSEAEALEYSDTKPGVMGRNPVYVNPVSGHVSTGWSDKKAWPWGGDWQVKTLPLYGSESLLVPRELLSDLVALAGRYSHRGGSYIDAKKVSEEILSILHPEV